jgi:lipoprotein-releasing system permease protein
MTTNLLLSIAWTHVSTRVRQTLVGMFGVAMGVGFTIMMAGLMQGSQIDFLRQLVDTMPHVTVEDERRSVPSQPAEEEYAAVGMSNVPNVNRRPGIKYPDTVMASLRSWLPGDVAPSVKTTALVEHGGARVGVTLTGIDPRLEVNVSKLASQMREGQLTDLSKAANGIIIGQALAEKLAVKNGNTVLLGGGQGDQTSATVVGNFRSGLKRVDEGQIYSLIGPGPDPDGAKRDHQSVAVAIERSRGRTEGGNPGRGADRIQVGVVARSQRRSAVNLRHARFHRADGDGCDAADLVICDL